MKVKVILWVFLFYMGIVIVFLCCFQNNTENNLTMDAIEALTDKVEIDPNGVDSKIVTKTSEYIGMEIEHKGGKAYLYKCYIIYEITDCIGTGKLACERGITELEEIRELVK